MNSVSSLSKLVNIACKSEATVLITGATGSGKTSLARQIHEGSLRKNKPFVVINLASLHEGTIESELFGHERGAFTGADQRRVGRLELAHGGTVFLDEVGELSLRLQARLLEFIQSRKITPVGSNREIQLDVRIIAATHRDIWEASARGDFREDLLHRLCVVSIRLCSLRDRTDEFSDLVHDCLDVFAKQAGKSILRISPAVAELFESYDWPGNLRELRNVLEYAVLACEGSEITFSDLPELFVSRARPVGGAPGWPRTIVTTGTMSIPLILDYQTMITSFDREYLRWALTRNSGKISRTARQIGMAKTTLLRRMKEYSLTMAS
jgi:DNA-binding NtrC family response regulator